MTKAEIQAAIRVLVAELGSTTRVAAKWNVSERSVANYAAGKLPKRGNRCRARIEAWLKGGAR